MLTVTVRWEGFVGVVGGSTRKGGVLAPEDASLTSRCVPGCRVLRGRPRAVCTFRGAKLLEPQKPPNGTWGVGWPRCLAELFPLASDRKSGSPWISRFTACASRGAGPFIKGLWNRTAGG